MKGNFPQKMRAPAPPGLVFTQNVPRQRLQTQVQGSVAPGAANVRSNLCRMYPAPLGRPVLVTPPGQVDRQACCWPLYRHRLHQGPAPTFSLVQGDTQPAEQSQPAQLSLL